MRKSRKYFIKTLSLNLIREIFNGVEKFVKTPYFKKRLEKFNLDNSYFTTIGLGQMLNKTNSRRRTLFKLFINGRFPMYVEFNPRSCDMGESTPNHHVRINLANIDNYQDLRTTIIHELTHLFDERDTREFAHYSYEDNPLEVSAREMENWFLNKFFFRDLMWKIYRKELIRQRKI